MRIDLTIEAEGIIEIENIDIDSLKISESFNGLVSKISDEKGNEVVIYGKNKMPTSNTFGGQLKDKFNCKTYFLELKGETYKLLKIN